MTKIQPEQTEAAPKRAAIYVRVSTEDQAEAGKESLPDQERGCRAHVERTGWTVAGLFSDNVSGSLLHRPGLDRLLADIAAGLIDVVVIKKLDRLSRDAGVLHDIFRLTDAAGVAWEATAHSMDRATAEGRLQTGILAEFAQFERAQILERTKVGIRGRAMNAGKPWGSEAAYGYRKDRDGDWEPNPDEVAIYRRVFCERVEAGRPYNAIATLFNREGIATRRGSNWTATTIKKILSGRYGLGEFFHDGEWIEGDHAPIISEEEWQDAQALASMGSKYRPSRGGRPAPHLFTGGMLRCAVCFEAMLARSDGDVYVCRTNKQLRGAGACVMPSLPREDVDRSGLRSFERIFLDLDATREHVTADLSSRLTEVEAQALRAGREAAEKAAQIDRIERDYLSEKLSADSYERMGARVRDELSAAQAESDRLLRNADTVRASQSEIDGEGEALHRLAELRVSALARVRTAEQDHDVDALRAAMAQTFKAVYVNPEGRVLGCEPRANRGNILKGTKVALPTRETTFATSGVPE